MDTTELVASFKEKFSYEDGKLFWKSSRARNVKAGDEVGYKRKDGYRLTWIEGKPWLVHRIIYVMHHNTIPKIVDHVNRNTQDNRIENLREVSRSINGLNTSVANKHSSGRKGVSWNKSRGRWEAHIKLNYKKYCLGYYKSKQEAIAAREAKEMELNIYA